MEPTACHSKKKQFLLPHRWNQLPIRDKKIKFLLPALVKKNYILTALQILQAHPKAVPTACHRQKKSIVIASQAEPMSNAIGIFMPVVGGTSCLPLGVNALN